MHVAPLNVDPCTSPQCHVCTQGRSWISWSIGKVMMWAKWTIYLIVQRPSRRSTIWAWIIVQLLILGLSEEAALSPPVPIFPAIIKEKANFIRNTTSTNVLSGRLSGAADALKAVACFGETGRTDYVQPRCLVCSCIMDLAIFIHLIISGSSGQCSKCIAHIPFKAKTSAAFAAFVTCPKFWNPNTVIGRMINWSRHSLTSFAAFISQPLQQTIYNAKQCYLMGVNIFV